MKPIAKLIERWESLKQAKIKECLFEQLKNKDDCSWLKASILEIAIEGMELFITDLKQLEKNKQN